MDIKPRVDAKEQSIPGISLPRGGGAIRAIGEKFTASSITGTGSMMVPIGNSPGRGGFGPQLSLAYDSGYGNGSFGLGWSLALPAIIRKTDKGLPQYLDNAESDVFILSGAEDLVPVFKQDQDNNWLLDDKGNPVIDDNERGNYTVRRYRPRIEGLFARIERWTNKSGDTYWRSVSKDNITTIYGKDSNSRISDPQTPSLTGPSRIFSWLICESYDDKGNAILYTYKAENSDGIDLSQTCEKNRDNTSRSANRYIKSIKYGNRTSRLVQPDLAQINDWMFEVVFDYGDHQQDNPQPDDSLTINWPCRHDPFSNYRAGFEIRTYRLCQRILMFHHFLNEPDVGQNCLVRATAITYRDIRNNPEDKTKGHPIASLIASISQSGYGQKPLPPKTLPPLEFEYSQATINDEVQIIDPESMENLPVGLDNALYRWVDLYGEGLPGLLTEQAGTIFYKSNLGQAQFGPTKTVLRQPSLAASGNSRQQLLDLTGDGRLELVDFSGQTPGFYTCTSEEDWRQFKPFLALPNIAWTDPNLRFIDLNGDGQADILITEDGVFTWYSSLGEAGFETARKVYQSWDTEKGPRVVFADATQSIFLADMVGDGLTDLVRIRNGEVCYWPNLGFGRFGARVTMDNSPWFDRPGEFSQQRLYLADIDGSGNTDLIYFNREGVSLYFNQAGNSWTAPYHLTGFPALDNFSTLTVADLLGNGTACLVWSSPLPGVSRQPLRYIDLMGGQKPYLLVKVTNNFGAETRIEYVSSTKFYLEDKKAGKPWITRLPFPVHLVERVFTYDYINRSRFSTRYAYHHGYFDGTEREFRGFGMVEQWDTELFESFNNGGEPPADNIDPVSNVPPVYTKSWFHTGVYLGREVISNYYAGLHDGYDQGEYYREPGWRNDDAAAKKRLLDDSVLPLKLTVEEEREGCRALKGALLRQEIYALDNSARAEHPYTVLEQNFTLKCLQPRAHNRHGVFFTHSREVLTYNYERQPENPRISHNLTLEADNFGNVLKSVAVGYGRRQPDLTLPAYDRARQLDALLTYTAYDPTRAVTDEVDNYRAPLPFETITYELTGYNPAPTFERFQLSDFVEADSLDPTGKRLRLISDGEIQYETSPDRNFKQRRIIERVRNLYRKNDLTGLLPARQLESMALAGESYKLAFTAGLLTQVFQQRLPNPAAILAGTASDRGGYIDLDNDGQWWIPSGRQYLSANPGDAPAQEAAFARQHFFLPQCFQDPFGQTTLVSFDAYNLLLVETRDPLDNRVTAGARTQAGNMDPTRPGNDYRVLQPKLITDANRNRTEVVFDTLGMVVGIAVKGKDDNEGDSLSQFEPDLSQNQLDTFYDTAEPYTTAPNLLKDATTRIIYDPSRFWRTKQAFPTDPSRWLPVYSATLTRETHVSETLPPGQPLKIQISFSHSDGFGREIQKKVQAKVGPVGAGNPIISPRWVGSGWTVFNNKGQPVRQYEPFYSQLPAFRHRFEFGVRAGVSPVLFYDPVGRVVATLHPNHTYEKVIFDPWRQLSYDVNDNTGPTNDPRLDPDIQGYVTPYFRLQPPTWQTWWQERRSGALGVPEMNAANQALNHANTPANVYFDTLGRPFLTLAHNGFAPNGDPIQFTTRNFADIEGNLREVRDSLVQNGDPLGRVVVRYDYDMIGNRIHQASMEAGETWSLYDIAGNPIRTWDSRNFLRRMTYDALRRPAALYLTENNSERLAELTVYGETQGEATNHRNRIYRVFDEAGVVTNVAYDFKGNLSESQLDLLPAPFYKQTVDWTNNPAADGGSFITGTKYDALNRPVALTSPDTSIYRPTYNWANLLESVAVNIRSANAATTFISDIDYNARGQRLQIAYGNGARSDYEYDPLTFRLVHLKTSRPANPANPVSPLFQNDTLVQDLSYTYDAVGNLTHLEDAAQRTNFYNNQQIDPVNNYTYDPLYRLIEAQGREHAGQNAFDFSPPTNNRRDFPFRGNTANPNNLQALRNYTQRYTYDAAGNFETFQHITNGGGWTRTYEYDEVSLVEPAKTSNRLTRTYIGSGLNYTENYNYTNANGRDESGCMTALNNLTMEWDFNKQLQKVDLGGGGTAFYVYNSGGQRVRKVIETQNGVRQKERLYLGGFEVYREFDVTGNSIRLERQSLHVMDDQQRVALLETLTIENGNPVVDPVPLPRYQLVNHLGSASVELAPDSALISYEEYHPFGTTALQAGRTAAETGLNRYRYTGKERDDETGLAYHGARYYAPWLGRWTSCDPAGTVDSLNLYLFVLNNPLRFSDPNGLSFIDEVNSFLGSSEPGPQPASPISKENREAKKLVLPDYVAGASHENDGSTGQSAAEKKYKGTGPDLATFKGYFELLREEEARKRQVQIRGTILVGAMAVTAVLPELAPLLVETAGVSATTAATTTAVLSTASGVGQEYGFTNNVTLKGLAFSAALSTISAAKSLPELQELQGPGAIKPGVITRTEALIEREQAAAAGNVGAQGELGAANYLQAEGQNVYFQTPVGPRGSNTADFLVGGHEETGVGGAVADVLTPISRNPNSIIRSIADKNGQAPNIIVNLSQTTVTEWELGDAMFRVRDGFDARNIQSIRFIRPGN